MFVYWFDRTTSTGYGWQDASIDYRSANGCQNGTPGLQNGKYYFYITANNTISSNMPANAGYILLNIKYNGIIPRSSVIIY